MWELGRNVKATKLSPLISPWGSERRVDSSSHCWNPGLPTPYLMPLRLPPSERLSKQSFGRRKKKWELLTQCWEPLCHPAGIWPISSQWNWNGHGRETDGDPAKLRKTHLKDVEQALFLWRNQWAGPYLLLHTILTTSSQEPCSPTASPGKRLGSSWPLDLLFPHLTEVWFKFRIIWLQTSLELSRGLRSYSKRGLLKTVPGGLCRGLKAWPYPAAIWI